MKTAFERFGAASVIGASHAEETLPNQDACLVKAYAFGMVLAVADGLGSKPLSQIGSKAACEAVGEAARIWARHPKAPVELFIRLIHSLWEVRIAPHSRSDCGTTCLFAIVFRTGRLICGQLGDGLIGFKEGGEFQVVADRADDGFTNETQSIHTVRGFADWTWVDRETSGDELGIVLATDGVSEDLIPQKRDAFLRHLEGMIAEQPNARRRNAAIRLLLVNWPVKHSCDDKTVVVFHRGANNDYQSERT
jgi:serine/threonine protein phosphatase PrpC